MKDSLHLEIDSQKSCAKRDEIRRRIALLRGAVLAQVTTTLGTAYEMLRTAQLGYEGMPAYLEALVELDMNDKLERDDIAGFIRYWFGEDGKEFDPDLLDDCIDGFVFVMNGYSRV